MLYIYIVCLIFTLTCRCPATCPTKVYRIYIMYYLCFLCTVFLTLLFVDPSCMWTAEPIDIRPHSRRMLVHTSASQLERLSFSMLFFTYNYFTYNKYVFKCVAFSRNTFVFSIACFVCKIFVWLLLLLFFIIIVDVVLLIFRLHVFITLPIRPNSEKSFLS